MSGAIYLTHPQWYDFLCRHPRSVVNFWRRDVRYFHMASPGGLFFCLVHIPVYEERFVGAVGKFRRFVVMTVRDAWERYGEGNGVASLTELLERLTDIGVLYATPNTEIGNIILEDFRPVVDAPPFTDMLADLGIDFQKGRQAPGTTIPDEVARQLVARLTLSTFESNAPFAPDYAPPARAQMLTSRVIRDTAVTRELKVLYGGRCQVCGEGISLATGETYVEAHHLKPLGRHHGGPDHRSNILILCPNHHAEFDYGAIMVEPATLTVRHVDSANRWHSAPLRLDPEHHPASDFLRYHAEHIFFGSA